jgi:hypothetical protein
MKALKRFIADQWPALILYTFAVVVWGTVLLHGVVASTYTLEPGYKLVTFQPGIFTPTILTRRMQPFEEAETYRMNPGFFTPAHLIVEVDKNTELAKP